MRLVAVVIALAIGSGAVLAEPILCFDGDAAGQRAASRGAERALPLLKPGRSLRFAYLPAGQDPDSLIQGQGVTAMQRVIDGAHPLMDMIWETETAVTPLDTPERRADLEMRLRKRVAQIADDTVKQHYGDMLRERLRETFRPSGRKFPPPKLSRVNLQALMSSTIRPRQKALIATLAHHPWLYDLLHEEISAVEFDPDIAELYADLSARILSSDPQDLPAWLKNVAPIGVDFVPSVTTADEVERATRKLIALMAREKLARELLEIGRAANASGREEDQERFFAIKAAIADYDRELIDMDDEP